MIVYIVFGGCLVRYYEGIMKVSDGVWGDVWGRLVLKHSCHCSYPC